MISTGAPRPSDSATAAFASRAAAAPFSVAVAARSDDDAIRRLLRNSPFGEEVSLSLEREPDSALASSIEGDEHATLVARDRSGMLAGIASRAVRTVFVNGSPGRIVYLGQLRIVPRFRRHRGLLAAGFDFIHELDVTSGGPRLHLASVVADNTAARRLLSRRTPGWPAFEPVDTLVSLAVPAGGRSSRALDGIACVRGSADRIGEIVSMLRRSGARHQFHPVWSREDLLSPSRSRNLSPDDFIVAMRDGRVVGCAACWDQRPFKQAVVRGYSPRLRRFRPLVNALAPLTGTPQLPATGQSLQFAYLSHLALDHDEDWAVMAALVRAARVDAGRRGLRYVVIGLSGAHPLVPGLRRALPHRAYESVLYVAFWPEAEALAASLDGRPSHPELAIL